MANFSGTHFGLISRIAIRPSPHPALYGVARDGVFIDAVAVEYDLACVSRPLREALAGRIARPHLLSSAHRRRARPIASSRRRAARVSRDAFRSSSRCSTRPRRIDAALAGARAAARARRRDHRGRWRQPRRHRWRCAAPLADRVVVERARARHADECRRSGRARRRAAVPACRHAASARCGPADRSTASRGRGAPGAASTSRSKAGIRCSRVVAAAMNTRSRLTGITTGDQAMFVTRAAFAAAGGFPAIALMEDITFARHAQAHLAAALAARARDDVGPALGDARRGAHDPADVAAAADVFFRRDAGRAGAALRLCAEGSPGGLIRRRQVLSIGRADARALPHNVRDGPAAGGSSWAGSSCFSPD